jgi:PAS domain S-box-containing protein
MLADGWELSEDNLQFSHKFRLDKPYTLTSISSTLCSLLGYTEQEIIDRFHSEYAAMVYSEDRARYIKFLQELASKEQTLALRYRMMTKQGEIIYINDITFSHKKQDGHMYGFSTIANITEAVEFHSAYSMFHMSSSVLPFGYLQCTCEKYPKVLCINDQMLDFLGESSASSDWNEFLRDNIFFMIPFEERDLFRSYLDAALNSTEPIKIKHKVLKGNGETCRLAGWISTIINQRGEKEYSLVYTDKAGDDNPTNNSHFQALESAYNIIFEINLALQTVECIYGRETSDVGKLYDVRMTLDSAMQFWVNNYIVDEDRDHMIKYFKTITTPGAVRNANRPLQTEFRIIWDDKVVYSFIGVAIQLDPSAILFCCRDTAKVQFSSIQAREVQASKKLRSFVDRYYANANNALGVLIIEKDSSKVANLIYASESAQKFLGWRHDQYLHFIESGLPLSVLETFAQKRNLCSLPDLFGGKKTTFIGSDNNSYIMQAISHQSDAYEIVISPAETVFSANIPQDCIFARTFGHFDIFVNGSLVVFSNSKEKELLALLIDRNGGSMTSNDAISYLWEDEYPDEKIKARFRKLAMGLKRTLQQYDIGHILINHNGIRSVDVQAFTCDYYEMLAGNEQYTKTFHNSYMEDYSWSERTLGTLWDYS